MSAEIFKELLINGKQVKVGSADRDGEGSVIKDTYARQDGYYTTLGAGTAEQLISTVGITDSDAYRFRTTAGNASVSDGNAEIKMLRGNTKQFNQLVHKPNSDSFSFVQHRSSISSRTETSFKVSSIGSENWGGIRNTDNNRSIIAGHKYYLQMILSDIEYTDHLSVHNGVKEISDTYVHFDEGVNKTAKIVFTSDKTTYNFYIRLLSGNVETGKSITISDFMLIDLTAMGLDSIATVEEFTALYPKAYYPYNAGTLYNPSFSAIKAVGFNAYNPNTGYAHVVKGIDDQGENNGYRVAGTYNSLYITESPSENPSVEGTLLTPESFTDAAGNTINRILPPYDGYVYPINPGSDFIMNIVWSGGRDEDTAEDNPYTEFVRELPVATYFPNELNSAKLAYDELTNNKATTRVKSVDLSTLVWTAGTGTYSTTISDIKSDTTNILCSRYTDDQIAISGQVVTITSSSTPVGTMNYELDTYVETPIDPKLNFTYVECDWGTEEFITTATNMSAELPVSNSTYYMNNLRDKLQNLNSLTPEELSECIAELD